MSMFSRSRTKIAGLIFASVISSHALAIDEVSVTDAPTPANHYEFSLISGYRAAQGKFDPYGNYDQYAAGSRLWSWTNIFAVGYRINHNWEISGSIAERSSRSTFPSGTTYSDSIGNPSLEGRYHTNWEHVAHLMFYGGLSMPYNSVVSHTYGDPSKDALSNDGLDGMIPGWSIRLGTGAFRMIEPIHLRVAVDFSMSVPFAEDIVPSDAPEGTPAISVKRANIYSLREGVAYPLVFVLQGLSINAGLSQMWEGDSSSDGQDEPTTASRAFGTSYGISYTAEDQWRVSAAFQTPWPFYSYLANQPYSPSVSVGLSYSGL